ncbi:hypothetical protein CCH79_00000396 [Gambusia affinis]|uniref:Zinc finger and BTB domain containing 2b n=2 Tax=Clupeocephala TaxID=186625 RepID=A0A315VWC1_GAMAF|nr:hypothetical protein CCH79_00000396 [Gambusia affinis]
MFVVFAFDVRHDTLANQSRVYQFLTQRLLVAFSQDFPVMELANHGLILLQQLNAQREFGFLCDCTVAIGDVFFKAHKAVLAAFSNYFRMLFIHQDSDCVRLKAADIQPDIFSYLLNLMYTGKLAPQLIDPARLEQGVRFLHAYPLLQEASQSVYSHPDQSINLSTSLYGIQISDQQVALSASQAASPPDIEASTSSMKASGEEGAMDVLSADGSSATAILHVKPSIMKRSSSFRKYYSCHLCKSRFTQRSLLREHLLQHTQALQQAAVEPSKAPLLPAVIRENSVLVEGSSKGNKAGSSASATAVEIISDSEQTLVSGTNSDSPQAEVSTSTWGVGGLSSQADTPPPSDIADIDNLENADLDREVKRRKYECSTCGRKFIQKSHWREHMYIHTGKPFKCSACGKSFCRANQAARHVCLNQGADTYTMVDRQSMELCAAGEDSNQMEAMFLGSSKPYKCNICATTFSSPAEVIKHLCFSQGGLAGLPGSAGAGMLLQQEDVSKDEGSDLSNSGTPPEPIKTEEILTQARSPSLPPQSPRSLAPSPPHTLLMVFALVGFRLRPSIDWQQQLQQNWTPEVLLSGFSAVTLVFELSPSSISTVSTFTGCSSTSWADCRTTCVGIWVSTAFSFFSSKRASDFLLDDSFCNDGTLSLDLFVLPGLIWSNKQHCLSDDGAFLTWNNSRMSNFSPLYVLIFFSHLFYIHGTLFGLHSYLRDFYTLDADSCFWNRLYSTDHSFRGVLRPSCGLNDLRVLGADSSKLLNLRLVALTGHFNFCDFTQFGCKRLKLQSLDFVNMSLEHRIF